MDQQPVNQQTQQGGESQAPQPLSQQSIQGNPMPGSVPYGQAAQGMPPNMMNFMANPALAAASAQFSATGMMNGPASFLAMPGIGFGGTPGMQTTSNGVGGGQQGVFPPQCLSSGNGTSLTNGQNGTNPVAAAGQMNFPLFMGAMPPNGMTPLTTASTLGALSLPNVSVAQPSSAQQVKVAAAAAAAAAAPLKNSQASGEVGSRKKEDFTSEQRARMNRERNREHARSTRLRKKAYVQKLKELVEGLHAERSEEMRKRRVAVQHLADVQNVRRSVVRSFLRNHASFEKDETKWNTLVEENFWFKQPVTPYRSFRRAEIEKDCRISRGVDALIADSASLSTMVDGTGSRSARWMQIKRREALQLAESRVSSSQLPESIVQDSARLQHAVSGLSSSSGSSHGSRGEEGCNKRRFAQMSQRSVKSSTLIGDNGSSSQDNGPKKVSASSSSGSDESKDKPSGYFHEYNAPDLPDPKMDEDDGTPSDDSPGVGSGVDSNNGDATKQVSTEASSSDGDDDRSDSAIKHGLPKRQKVVQMTVLPSNIARSGGIAHNVQPVDVVAVTKRNSRLSKAPAISLPPFAGIGKRPEPTSIATVKTSVTGSFPGNTGATQDVTSAAVSVSLTGQSDTSNQAVVFEIKSKGAGELAGVQGQPTAIPDNLSVISSMNQPQVSQIRAYYHVNEDDMLLTDDVLMCPFIFRSQDAVLCGALAECIMPGMLRANFSSRNKLLSLEMVYDAMGFMQQLERASGSDGSAQIVPGSLEMALAPNCLEARVITLAKEPFLIVSVNEAWTKATKYTQLEVEGKNLSILNGMRTSSEAATRPGKPAHTFEEVARGRAACSTNIHYDKDGREFVDFMSSYPLSNANDEVTHILHVCKELPLPASPSYTYQDSREATSSSDNPSQ